MTNIKQFLGARIKEVRKKSAMKQAELAEIIGVEPNHLSKIECGTAYPSFDLLDKISQALNVDLTQLLSQDHLKSKEELLNEIEAILKNQEIEKIKTIYRIIKDIVT